ncbi:MAG: metal ABC transporter permease [Desertifilum sp. SIO1I2]|nr:metal ABC transporter permease [Desertifilum sp. SIO1I2]
MLNLLLEPLGYEFMRNAIAIGVVVGILCPVVGTYLIVQRMALLGDVIAETVIPGMAIAYFFRLNLLAGAFVSGICSTLLITWIRANSRIKVDGAMAIICCSFFALGILLISILRTNIDLEALLFGDILGVRVTDVQRTAIVAVIVLVLIKLFYKELLFYTFDRQGAQALGLPVNFIYFGLLAAVTLTIISSLQIVGVILVVSLLICPGITAYLLVKQLHQMMWLGSLIGVVSTVSGMYLSYYFDIPSGPAIVLVTFAFFLLAFLFSPSQGLLTRPEYTQYYAWFLKPFRSKYSKPK